MENLSPLLALGAGLLSIFLPCVLPLIPVYLVSIYGDELLNPGTVRWRVFLHSLCFVVGFSLVFTAIGAAVGLLGLTINPNSLTTRLVSGGLLVFFGLFMLLALKVPALNYEKRLSAPKGLAVGYIRSFVTGAAFTLAWTPCLSPILGGILGLAWGSETAWRGAALLASYSLGLGLPFLAVGAAFESLAPLIRRINRYSGIIYIISSLLLIGVGVLILANKLNWFATPF